MSTAQINITAEKEEAERLCSIRNAVYGLALGDAMGFVTERMRFPEIKKAYLNGSIVPFQTDMHNLIISDDTQTSLILVESIEEQIFCEGAPQSVDGYLETITENLVMWHRGKHDFTPRGVGNATKKTLEHLSKFGWDDPFAGADNYRKINGTVSKGSGTVMRAPWLGLLEETIPDDKLERFSDNHSRITHSSLTARHSAYFTSLITRELYRGVIECGEIREYILDHINSYDSFDSGLSDIDMAIELADELPKGWKDLSLSEFDPSSIMGRYGRADTVLATAIVIADAYGKERPLESLARGMMTNGDSDTINALVGAFVGASHATEHIWEDADWSFSNYVESRLVGAVDIIARQG